MERDLNGIPMRDVADIASRRTALEMAALAQQAIDAGRFENRGETKLDPETHKPRSKWSRKDGSTGQREPWQRQLSGHKAGQQRKARNASSTTSPTP